MVDAIGGSIRACAYDTKFIRIDDAFNNVKLGGFAALVDAFLNIYESWVYMELVTVKLCESI